MKDVRKFRDYKRDLELLNEIENNSNWIKRRKNHLNCVSFSISQHQRARHSLKFNSVIQTLVWMMMMKILWFMIIMRHEIWSCNNFRWLNFRRFPLANLTKFIQHFHSFTALLDFFQLRTYDESGQLLGGFQLIRQQPGNWWWIFEWRGNVFLILTATVPSWKKYFSFFRYFKFSYASNYFIFNLGTKTNHKIIFRNFIRRHVKCTAVNFTFWLCG